jgi:hypothetical protein
MNKRWEKPKLVVLVRGKPEEAVLAACKNVGYAAGSPSAIKGNCKRTTSPTTCGGSCSRVTAT